VAAETQEESVPGTAVAAPARSSGGDTSLGRLSGRAKAAILLVNIGSERAADVFKLLGAEEVEELSLEMAKMRQVPRDVSSAVVREAIETALAHGYLAEGGVEFAREVLERSVGPERAADIIARLSAVIERRPFEFLRRTPADQLQVFLRNESPQAIALVLANLHSRLAAQVLREFPADQQAEIARRVATIGETSPAVTQAVEAVMREKLSTVISQDFTAAGGVKSLADILNQADRATERHVLEQLAETDRALADEVRMLLFTFEDLCKLDDRSIQLVLKDIETKDLALALRGVPDEVSERIFANMSQRGAEMLREEMEFQPPQRRSVVEEAQSRVVAVVRRLEETGEIVIARQDGDDELIQ
jgi:flagellar motor switch protein FliG